jgi:hypothetical protein
VARRFCTALVLAAVGCSARPSLRDDPDVRARGQALVLAAAAAHGGVERWRALGGVTLHMRANGPYYPRDAQWLLDPARNRGVVHFTGKHGPLEWRYDGKRGTILEGGRCVGSSKQRAKVGGLISNVLYWFGVPFKFLDAGATVRAVDGDRFLVTYRGVGDTPDDWFLVTLGADRRVHDAVYVASGFTKLLEFRNVWERWSDVDGFAVGVVRRVEPKNAFLRWLAPRFAYQLDDVRLQQPLDDAAFTPPAGCP